MATWKKMRNVALIVN